MPIEKFEIGRRLFENFRKFEEQSSNCLEIGKLEGFQMNDAFMTCKSEVAIQLQIEALKSLSKIARQIVPMSQPSQHQIFGCNEN